MYACYIYIYTYHIISIYIYSIYILLYIYILFQVADPIIFPKWWISVGKLDHGQIPIPKTRACQQDPAGMRLQSSWDKTITTMG